MYTGFVDEVPAAQMHVCIDAVVPIQEALGVMFCGDEHAACRPNTLVSIELFDTAPSAARVVVERAGEQLEMRLVHKQGSWEAAAGEVERICSAVSETSTTLAP